MDTRTISHSLYLITDLFTFPSKLLLIDIDSDGDYICLQLQNFYHA